jgi:hypothetical protein
MAEMEKGYHPDISGHILEMEKGHRPKREETIRKPMKLIGARPILRKEETVLVAKLRLP